MNNMVSLVVIEIINKNSKNWTGHNDQWTKNNKEAERERENKPDRLSSVA